MADTPTAIAEKATKVTFTLGLHLATASMGMLPNAPDQNGNSPFSSLWARILIYRDDADAATNDDAVYYDEILRHPTVEDLTFVMYVTATNRMPRYAFLRKLPAEPMGACYTMEPEDLVNWFRNSGKSEDEILQALDNIMNIPGFQLP